MDDTDENIPYHTDIPKEVLFQDYKSPPWV